MNMDWITAIAALGPLHWGHWALIAIGFFLLEILSPIAFFLWIAIAAGIMAIVLPIFPEMSWQTQLILFGGLSLLSLILGRLYLRLRPTPTDTPNLNKRGQQYVGRTFRLEQPIVNNAARLRIDDTSWKIIGPDCREGTTIRVIASDGILLHVAPLLTPSSH